MDQNTIMKRKKIPRNPIWNVRTVELVTQWPLLNDLSVEIYFPGPGVGIVLLLLLLAAREHAADQALGAGHAGRGARGLSVLVALWVLDQWADLGHT